MRTFLTRAVWTVAGAVMLVVAAGPLAAQTTREKYEARLRRGSPFNLAAAGETTYTLNINNWLCGLNDAGQSCVNTFGSTTGGGGFWPIGTTNQYIFDFGLQIAARDPADPNRFAAMHCFNVSGTNAACTQSGRGIFHSDNPADLDSWPEACFLWNPQTGERVKTLSQLDTCVQYTDFDPSRTVPGGHPMGIEVTQHTLSFTLSGFRDMIFFIYKIKNQSHTAAFKAANPSVPAGGWELRDIYLAVGHDADVSSDEVDENFGTFVPFLNPETPLWIGTIWQGDFEAGDFQPYAQCGFCSNPGFVGTTFLRSPYNTTGQTIHTNVAGVQRDVPSIDKERLEQLRLAAAQGDEAAQDTLKTYEIGQSFGSLTTRGGVFPDPEDAAQSWRYYSGNLNDQERAQTAGAPPGFGFVDQPAMADTRYFHATGPFNLAPGDSAEVIVGLVAGAPVLDVPGFTPGTVVDHGLPGDTARLIEKIMGRGSTHTAYPSLFKQVLDARTLFETNFLLPSPPPAPTVTAIPGNREVALTWSDDVVTASDPYYPIAVQRGIPGYREQDFEGYRVYRKVRPNADWELIAQFDLKNGATEVVTVTDSVITEDGVVVIAADTARVGTDTGLQFSLIDRGGRFPDPSAGTGLTNGVTYYYTVTAYDLNSAFAPGGSSLESGQRLSAQMQAVGGAAATPRAPASNLSRATFTPRMLGSDDSEVDMDAPMPPIDPETGTFAGPMPPTDGIRVIVTPIADLVKDASSLTVTIDSIVPGNPSHGDPAKYFLTAEAPAGTQSLVVDMPVGYFGDSDGSNLIPNVVDVVRADNRFGDAFRVDPGPVKLTADIRMGAPDNYYNAGTGRGFVNGAGPAAWNGPRWFVSGGQEPAHPNAGLGDWWCGNDPGCAVAGGLTGGAVPGYDVVLLKAYLTTTSAARALEGVLSTVRRAADIEVTWGSNGQVERVFDLTHKVDVTFNPAYRATYGFLTPESFAGVDASLTPDGDNAIITSSDFECVAPMNELAVAGETDFDNCPSPVPAVLQPAAQIVPISWESGYFAETDAPKNGFAMYINGERFFFFGDQLPNAGDRWVLRTYVGYVTADYVAAPNDATPEPEDSVMVSVTDYAYTPVVRPPNVPGLRIQVAMTPTVIDVATRDLARVHTVPDPYLATSALQATSADRKIMFVNLPERATIRIFSLSGVLVDAIDHDDPSGGGVAYWDLKNRNEQYVASGVYFFHISTPDGKAKVGKFTIIQAP